MSAWSDDDVYSISYGINSGGDVNITGGTVTAAASGTDAYGIESNGNVNITGGTVTATASGTNIVAGICSNNGNVNISGGTVTATASGTNIIEAISGNAGVNISESADVTATASGTNAIGICCKIGNVNISGGTVNVTANEDWSFGIVCRGENVNISGGTVNVTVIDDNSVGVGSDEGDVAISGGTVTIIGGYNAFYVTTTNAVTLTDNYANPAKRTVMVSTTAISTNAAKWDETTRLDSTEYKYVRIAPVSAPAPTHGGTPIYWWSNQNPQPESTPTLPDVDTLITPTPTSATATPSAIPSATPAADTEEPPQTGDSSTMLGFVMIIAAIALTTIVMVGVKRRNAERI